MVNPNPLGDANGMNLLLDIETVINPLLDMSIVLNPLLDMSKMVNPLLDMFCKQW